MTQTEVAVIGLGAIGSMTLWRLAERGVRVHGYERYGAAHDQGASAGETRRFSVQSQRDRRFTPLAIEAQDLWRELTEFSGRELFRQTGGLIVGPRGTPAIASAVASAQVNGLPYESLEADALRSRFPQHVVRDGDVGVTDPLAGYLRPEASVASAVERAGALGAAVSLHTEAVAVDPRADGVAVITRDGEQIYERVVWPQARGPVNWCQERPVASYHVGWCSPGTSLVRRATTALRSSASSNASATSRLTASRRSTV